MALLIAGIEGGATISRIVLLDSSGNQLGYVEGPPTNPWLLGLEEAAERILNLVKDVLINSNRQSTETLAYLGLSLSGADTEANQNELVNAIKKHCPNIAQEIHICNDSIGTYLTVCDKAAIVLISGTGSICCYVRENLTFQRIGGGYWIAQRMIKKLISSDDKIIDTTYNLDNVRRVIYAYFNVENNLELLQHFYTNFSKNKIAGLCEHFSQIARTGDQLAKDVFHDAGVQLAQHVRAALYYCVMDSMSSNQNLTVVCCGSVFKSWDLIRDGFKDFLKPSEDSKWTGTLELVQLKHSAAYGAARLSVHFDSKVTIPIDSGVQFDKILFGVNF
uniref:N-acetyl-D-glucosamine kinase n=1 Tax=Schistosoma haematobium TaxID=6185 RepID=A0A095AIM2_SCHHA